MLCAGGTLVSAPQHGRQFRDHDRVVCMQHAIIRVIGDQASQPWRVTCSNVSKNDYWHVWWCDTSWNATQHLGEALQLKEQMMMCDNVSKYNDWHLWWCDASWDVAQHSREALQLKEQKMTCDNVSKRDNWHVWWCDASWNAAQHSGGALQLKEQKMTCYNVP